MKEALKNIDKKTLKVAGIGIGVLILLIVGIAVLVRLTDKKYYSYADVEKKLVDATKEYYKDNPSYLPTVENGTSSVTANTLMVNEYIASLDTLLKNGAKCSAEVVVTKLMTTFDYTPYLNCGQDYNSIELYNKVLQDNLITTTGFGLYDIANEKVFRGEVKNNFVLLDKNLWRIVKIDEDNNLVLMSHFKTNTISWDNRYNEETQNNYGINNYNISRVKEVIENTYYNEGLLTDSIKSKVVLSYWCLGSRKITDADNMKNIECSELTEEKSPIGLLTVYEYLQASIDPNCHTIEDRGCTNYNYMHDRQSTFWTITKGQKNTSYVYNITSSGVAESRANTTKQVRYVIKLGQKAIYQKGSGTETEPYEIR